MAVLNEEVRVFSEEIAQYYESNGLFSPVAGNKRKVSTSIISPPSSRVSSAESSLSNNSIFEATSLTEELPQIEIPVNLQSMETYMFLGFTKAKADDLWKRYCFQPEGMDADFLDMAQWAVEEPGITDAQSSSDDWKSCMEDIGIDDELRQAILLAEFEDIRFTATCKFWLLDVIQTRYDTLSSLNERMRQDEFWVHRHRISRKGHSQRPSLASPSGRKPLTSTAHPGLEVMSTPAPPTPNPTTAQTPSITPSVHEKATPSANIATSPGPPSAMNLHTMIWRAGSRIKCEEFYDELNHIINLSAVCSIPGDFNGRKTVAYWTPQKETADRYAQWAKHKVPISEIAIIQVAVPETLIRSLETGYLWFSPAWKNVVWHCRNGRYLPKDVAEYEEKDLLIGHIASGKDRKFVGMKDFNTIKEDDVLTVSISGEMKKSVQWVFQTRKAEEGFEEQCKGKVWIHRLGPYFVAPKESS